MNLNQPARHRGGVTQRTRPNRSKVLRSGVVVVLLALLGLGVACTPAGQGGIPTETWRIEGTQVTVNDSQDEVCPIVCVNREDEPYLLQIAFRVKLGVNGSATAWVVGDRNNDIEDLGAGQTGNLDGAARATATFAGIRGLDAGDLLNTNNHLELFGTYTWAAEKDEISIGSAASGTATIFKNALNAVIAQATGISNDPNVLSNQLKQNLGATISIFLNNLPTFGLGDDVLGGSLNIGVAAKGTLGRGLDLALANAPISPTVIPGSLPPDIQGGRWFTLTKSPHVFYQTYTGAGGQHTYKLRIAKDVSIGNSGVDVPAGGFTGDLVSPGGVRLSMQGDGNLVIYSPASQGNMPIWDSGTRVAGSALWMQGDGNLVIYNAAHQWVWDTSTNGHPGSVATLQDDGNLVVYGPGHVVLWESRSHI